MFPRRYKMLLFKQFAAALHWHSAKVDAPCAREMGRDDVRFVDPSSGHTAAAVENQTYITKCL